jgi:pseudouridine kinase
MSTLSDNLDQDRGDAPFVAVIGAANIDIHGKSKQPLRSNDSNPGSINTSVGGVARNIAENLARLGVDCRLVSAVGNDHYGQTLLRLSNEAGVDVHNVLEIASAATSTYLSVLDETGDMQVAIADMSIMEQLTAERLKPAQPMLREAAMLVIDTNLPDDAIVWLTDSFTDKPIFADTVSSSKAPRLRPYLSSIHTLKSSPVEVEALTGLEAQTPAQLSVLARYLHTQGVERVFITRGEQGVFYSTRQGEFQGEQKLPRDDHAVQNAGGAGDAFLAGLVYAWLEEQTLQDSLQFALTTADITLSHKETNNPALSLVAVQQAMEAQNGT